MTITTTPPQPGLRTGTPCPRQAGFTIVEVMISMGIGLLVLTVMVAMSIYTAGSFYDLATYAAMDKSDRLALDQLTTEFRQATNVLSFSTNSVSLAKLDGDIIRYTWNPQTQIVVRQLERKSVTGTITFTTNTTVIAQKTLLDDCSSFLFTLYKASPTTNGTMDLDTTADLRDCKAIKVQWKCVRNLSASKSVTETITSGTVVMRMQETDY